MKFKNTKLPGEYIIIPEKIEDDRGFFYRVVDLQKFAEQNLNTKWPQTNTFFSHKLGTLRGLAYQTEPKAEVKLIRCTRGEIYDVALDLRPDSETFGQYTGAILNPDNGIQHYIPQGFAHGYITLSDHTEVVYQVSETYSPEHAHGIRWNDPRFNIQWPTQPQIISDKDNNYEDYK